MLTKNIKVLLACKPPKHARRKAIVKRKMLRFELSWRKKSIKKFLKNKAWKLNGARITRIRVGVMATKQLWENGWLESLKKAIYDWFCYFPTSLNLSSPVWNVNHQSKFRAQVVIVNRVKPSIIRERVLLGNDGQGGGSCGWARFEFRDTGKGGLVVVFHGFNSRAGERTRTTFTLLHFTLLHLTRLYKLFSYTQGS